MGAPVGSIYFKKGGRKIDQFHNKMKMGHSIRDAAAMILISDGVARVYATKLRQQGHDIPYERATLDATVTVSGLVRIHVGAKVFSALKNEMVCRTAKEDEYSVPRLVSRILAIIVERDLFDEILGPIKEEE